MAEDFSLAVYHQLLKLGWLVVKLLLCNEEVVSAFPF